MEKEKTIGDGRKLEEAWNRLDNSTSCGPLRGAGCSLLPECPAPSRVSSCIHSLYPVSSSLLCSAMWLIAATPCASEEVPFSPKWDSSGFVHRREVLLMPVAAAEMSQVCGPHCHICPCVPSKPFPCVHRDHLESGMPAHVWGDSGSAQTNCSGRGVPSRSCPQCWEQSRGAGPCSSLVQLWRCSFQHGHRRTRRAGCAHLLCSAERPPVPRALKEMLCARGRWEQDHILPPSFSQGAEDRQRDRHLSDGSQNRREPCWLCRGSLFLYGNEEFRLMELNHL